MHPDLNLAARHLGPWIHGKWVHGKGAEWPSINPATGETIGVYQSASTEQVDEAVQHAWEAFHHWSMLPLSERLVYIRAYRDLLKKLADPLASLLAEEHGKPLWEARAEISAMIGKIDISEEAYQKRTPSWKEDNSQLHHKPLGAVGILGPYNIPAHLMNGHFIPALIAGNTVIIKPSEWTPRVGAILAGLWEAVDLPNGVFQLLPGGRETGEALAHHPRLAGLYFTGSMRTGLALHRAFAGQPDKMLALEMGGNNPLIIWGTVDEKAALYHTIQSAFLTTGQRCTCARRMFLHERMRPWVQSLCHAASKLAVGAWDHQPAPFMGPVIGKEPARQLLDTQSRLLDLGARSLLTMKHLSPKTGFVTPAILDVTPLASDHWPDEEYFGPFLQIRYVPDLAEAVNAANRTRYGLSAGIFSDDPHDFEWAFPRLKAGVINWNRPLTSGGSGAGATTSSHLPFGGVGLSGNFRPTAYYAADSMAYPVSTQWQTRLSLPDPALWTPGVVL